METLIGDRLLTPEEVADLLAVTTDWVREQARSGDIPAIQLGRYWRFSRSAIEEWLTSRQSATYKRRTK